MITVLAVIAACAVSLLAGVWLAGPVATWVDKRQHQGRHRAPDRAGRA